MKRISDRRSVFGAQHTRVGGVNRLSRVPRGITLLEILVSLFVLSVGLLGVASLIPLGRLAVAETEKSDRTGACGRAAIRDIQVRRLLNYTSDGYPHWSTAMTSPSAAVAIDPLGFAHGLTTRLGGASGTPARYTLTNASGTLSQTAAEQIFLWPDDLIFMLPGEIKDAKPNGERPAGMFVQSGNSVSTTITDTPATRGDFSWFFTAVPSATEVATSSTVRTFDVSVVVCYKRDFQNEYYSSISAFDGGDGGGTIQVADATVLQHIRRGQWVLLSGTATATSLPTPTAKWYRVVGVGDADSPYVSLVGPDWDTTHYPYSGMTLAVIEGVTGVYTATITLDNGT